MATDSKTFLDDTESLKSLINKMPPDDKADYIGFGALGLESAFPGRKMVVYTLRTGIPSDIDVVTFGDFRVSWEIGPSFEVSDRDARMLVRAVPQRLNRRDVYIHVPQSFTLKYKGRQVPSAGVDFVAHYAVLLKTRSKEIHQVDGHTYVCTLNKFRERFPDLKIRY